MSQVPVNVPFEWVPLPELQPPRATWLDVPVYQDYDPCRQFGRNKRVFHNSREFARRAKADAGHRGRKAAILLTHKSEAPAFEAHHDDGETVYFVVNVHLMRNTDASAVDTARARTGVVAADPTTRELVEKLKKSAVNWETFLKDELSARIVLDWCSGNPARVESLAKATRALGERDVGDLTPFALEVLSALGGSIEQLEEFARRATDPALYLGAAAALYARQYIATEELSRLIKADEPEREFQRFFEKHHWMFGPHYAALVDRRVFTVGSQYDIPLIATDGFLDLIELKRPSFDVFRWDESHKCYQPSPELSQALGQAQHYIATNDAEVYTISQRFKVPAHRIRATIVIGKFEKNDEEQRKALRNLNSHLTRIEVRTFTDVLDSARAIQRYTAETLAAVQRKPTVQKG